MRYQRTQIYLDPEEHRRLTSEAAEREISLAAYLREILAARTGEAPAVYEAKSWDSFIGCVSAGPKRHVDDPDDEVSAAILDNYLSETATVKPSADS